MQYIFFFVYKAKVIFLNKYESVFYKTWYSQKIKVDK